MTSQVRKAATAIPTNIAEGCGRSTNADLARFADIAMGSASETEYQLLLAQDLHYFDSKTYRDLEQDVAEVKRMLAGYIRYLRAEERKKTSSRRTPDT